MAPKFIVDINLPDTAAEDQMAACQRKLEELLEDHSATPLSVEPVEGDDNVGVDTTPKEKPVAAKPAAKATATPEKALTELHAIVLRQVDGTEAIATFKGFPIIFGNKQKFDEVKKRFRSQLVADPAPAGMKFFHVVFGAIHMVGEVK